MIQDVMRKHKRAILWLTLGLIIVPFVMWGGYSGLSSQRDNAGAGGPVATVEGAQVDPDQFRAALDNEINRRNQTGKSVSYRDLEADGTAQMVLQQMLYQSLMKAEAHRAGWEFDRSLLVDQLKKDPSFQDEKGKYDPKLWNNFLAQEGRRNWNNIYNSIAEQLRMQIMSDRAMSASRVFDSEIRKQFEEMKSTIQVKYVAIDLPDKPTEEQIQKQYSTNVEKYALPEKRSIQYATVSLEPPRPAAVDEVVAKLNAGEDFAALAKTYSKAPDADKGGDLGWVTEDLTQPPFRQPLFALEAGKISAPFQGAGGYFIYKAEEVKTDEVTKQRQVHGREIYISAMLTPEERKARLAEAQSVLDKAKTSGSLEQAAAEAKLTVKTSPPFSGESKDVEGIPQDDLYALAGGLSKVAAGAFAEQAISGARNAYIVKVVAVEPAVPQPLEVVRDRVEQDALAALKQSPEYRQKVTALMADIRAKAKSLQDILAAHPELNLTVKETKPFAMSSYDFTPGEPMWNRAEVFTMVGDKQPGAFGGPVRGFDGNQYFVELVAKTPPDQKAWDEDFPKEKDQIEKSLLSMRQRTTLEDYMQNLYEANGSKITINQEAIDQLLGLRDQEQAPAENSAAPAAS